jgi:hypothetical protein
MLRAPAIGATSMPRFYFHIMDGQTYLDDTGSELANIEAARKEAVQISREVILQADGLCHSIWNGETCKVWATDKPSGSGTTILTLQIMASAS